MQKVGPLWRVFKLIWKFRGYNKSHKEVVGMYFIYFFIAITPSSSKRIRRFRRKSPTQRAPFFLSIDAPAFSSNLPEIASRSLSGVPFKLRPTPLFPVHCLKMEGCMFFQLDRRAGGETESENTKILTYFMLFLDEEDLCDSFFFLYSVFFKILCAIFCRY